MQTKHSRTMTLLAATVLSSLAGNATAEEPITLREAYADKFLVGAALNGRMVRGDSEAGRLAGAQFSALTAENDMKWQSLHPRPGQFRFEAADAYFEFARKHDMKVIGHTLVWHSQTPRWVFEGEGGEPPTREEMLGRMREHIHTVAGRYKGKVQGWDVVNEALSDRGGDILRDSPWRRLIGDDFIDHAFRFAREADPEAELYYNDYSLENARKRENCVKLVKGMLERGVPIDGIGTQAHLHIGSPSLEDIEKTIEAFSALGLKVMVTELDVDVLPGRGEFGNADISRRERGGSEMNPYPDGLPAEMQEKLARRYKDIFKIYLRHSEAITRVTFWGLSDRQTWLNGFPIRGRTNHPLLFDRELKPKPAFDAVIAAAREAAAEKKAAEKE